MSKSKMASKSITHSPSGSTVNHWALPAQSSTGESPSPTSVTPSPVRPNRHNHVQLHPCSPYHSKKPFFHVTKRGVVIIHDSDDEGDCVGVKKGGLVGKDKVLPHSDDGGPSNHKTFVPLATAAVEAPAYSTTVCSWISSASHLISQEIHNRWVKAQEKERSERRGRKK